MVAKSVLAGLIERTLIAQEAKRELKNPKQLDRLYEAADKFSREEELPPMMRRYMVDNEPSSGRSSPSRAARSSAPPELSPGIPGPGLHPAEARRTPEGRAS